MYQSTSAMFVVLKPFFIFVAKRLCLRLVRQFNFSTTLSKKYKKKIIIFNDEIKFDWVRPISFLFTNS